MKVVKLLGHSPFVQNFAKNIKENNLYITWRNLKGLETLSIIEKLEVFSIKSFKITSPSLWACFTCQKLNWTAQNDTDISWVFITLYIYFFFFGKIYVGLQDSKLTYSGTHKTSSEIHVTLIVELKLYYNLIFRLCLLV